MHFRQCKREDLVDELGRERFMDYKKSIFATLFALFMALCVIFAFLYSQCFASYKEIADRRDYLSEKYGICNSCHEHSYCSNMFNTTYQCYCRHGYIGDGVSHCEDISFAIEFRENATSCPTIDVNFPKTNTFGFCMWLEMSHGGSKWLPIFSYIADNRKDSLMLSVNNDEQKLELQRFDKAIPIKIEIIPEHYYMHFCTNWKSNGQIELYVNGHIYKQERLMDHHFTEGMLKTKGKFYLGRYVDVVVPPRDIRMYKGKISQFFMYDKYLTAKEIVRLFQHDPSSQGMFISWLDFKNKTSGWKIAESYHIIL